MVLQHDTHVSGHPVDVVSACGGASVPPRPVSSMSTGVATLLGLVGLVGATVLGFAFGGGINPMVRGPRPQMSAPLAPPAVAPKSTKFEVTANEFSLRPAKTALDQPGQLVVKLTNTGVVEHDFVIAGI